MKSCACAWVLFVIVVALSLAAISATSGAAGGHQAAVLRIAESSTMSTIMQLGECLYGGKLSGRALPKARKLTSFKDAVGGALERCLPEFVPACDGYGRPYLYWSDGADFVVLSKGRDGKLDRDYDARLITLRDPVAVFCDSGAQTDVEDDVVFLTDQYCRPVPRE